MITLKSDPLNKVSLSIRHTSFSLDFVISNNKKLISCTFESLIHHNNDNYVIFKDLYDNLYAFLIVAAHSERPLLIEPALEKQKYLVEQYLHMKSAIH